MAVPAYVQQPVDLVVNALNNAGCNPRQSGPTQWYARCPVSTSHTHGDKSPSLSVGESPVGKALITCHTGCTVPQICQALNLSMRDLFPDDGAPKVTGKDHPEAVYDYHSEDGTLLFQVVKIRRADGGKTFRARAPIPDELGGGWTHNANGIRRVLYHLPQVIKAVAEQRMVVITEGEKDSENAQWWWPDAACTTNPFGAGPGKWQAEYNEVFRGADVVIVADDDTIGHGHAWEIKMNLAGIARSCRIFLPARGFKDLSEMMGAGKTVRDLRPYGPDQIDPEPVDELDEFGLPATVTGELVDSEDWAHLVDWAEFWAEEYADEDWLCYPIIPTGRSVAVYAKAKEGKSAVILAAVAALATGKPVFGEWTSPAGPVNVLYCDYEMTRADLHERMVELGYGPEDDLSHLHYCTLPSLGPLDDDRGDGPAKLLALARKYMCEMVIIDTYGRAVDGDENDADTTRRFYRYTGSLLKAAGIAVVRIDHAGKDAEKGQRGSSAKNDDVDIVWSLQRVEGGSLMTAKFKRLGDWVPQTVLLDRVETDDGIQWIRKLALEAVPLGTKRVIDDLDALGVDPFLSARKAVAELRAGGKAATDKLVRAAQRTRKQAATETGRSIIARSVAPVLPPRLGGSEDF